MGPFLAGARSLETKQDKLPAPFCRIFGSEVQFLVLFPVNGGGVKKHKGLITIYRDGRFYKECNVTWLTGSCENQMKGFFGIQDKCKIGVAKAYIQPHGQMSYTGSAVVDGFGSDIFVITGITL